VLVKIGVDSRGPDAYNVIKELCLAKLGPITQESRMILKEFEPEPMPVRQAEENLRVIRELMERSTRYSTFSGFSGVCAGLVSIAGCLIQGFWVLSLPPASRNVAFLATWTTVVLLAVGIDYLLTKRRAPMVGKTINSRLGRQMVIASFPGLFSGALLTLFLLHHGMMEWIYPFWMLSYGIAVSAVGLFSQREVGRLGAAFIGTGAFALLLETVPIGVAAGTIGIVLTAVAFGGFHILYGVVVARRGGW
jgi:hypothetical protein